MSLADESSDSPFNRQSIQGQIIISSSSVFGGAWVSPPPRPNRAPHGSNQVLPEMSIIPLDSQTLDKNPDRSPAHVIHFNMLQYIIWNKFSTQSLPTDYIFLKCWIFNTTIKTFTSTLSTFSNTSVLLKHAVQTGAFSPGPWCCHQRVRAITLATHERCHIFPPFLHHCTLTVPWSYLNFCGCKGHRFRLNRQAPLRQLRRFWLRELQRLHLQLQVCHQVCQLGLFPVFLVQIYSTYNTLYPKCSSLCIYIQTTHPLSLKASTRLPEHITGPAHLTPERGKPPSNPRACPGNAPTTDTQRPAPARQIPLVKDWSGATSQ